MDDVIESLLQRVIQTQHGFTDIRRAADELAARYSTDERQHLAEALYHTSAYQARSLATFLYGDMAAQSELCLTILRAVISGDKSWQVQEILAKAFDRFCADTGYERALPTIIDWLGDESPNVRRAVTEGLRIWTARPYFKEHPGNAIALLSQHRADPSEYLRKSVGNALRDISRKQPDLVRAELALWDLSDKRTAFTHKLAAKFL